MLVHFYEKSGPGTVVVIHPVSAGREWYWSAGPEAGHWYGRGAGSLGLQGEVTSSDLRRALRGQPIDHVPKNRRDGFDLVIAAPKSVSLLAALAPPRQEATMLLAHRAAVLEALGFLDRHAVRARGPARLLPPPLLATEGMVAATFRHGENRLGHPHLHTHVVTANLCRADGRWRCLDSRSLFAHARAAGAIYQAALRESLAANGLVFEWHVRAGALADVDGVPRAAIEACSAGKRDIRRGSVRPGGREVKGDTPELWRARTAAAGFGRSEATRLLEAAMSRTISVASEAGDEALASRLESAGSTFRFTDAVIAAASSPAGARALEVERRAARLTLRAIAVPVSAAHTRWTTAVQLARDREIIERAVARHTCRPPAGAVAARLAAAALALRPGMGRLAVSATEDLLLRGQGVTVLKAEESLAAAQVLEAAGAAWAAGYHCVELVGPLPDRGRWRLLTGIEPTGRPPTVLVVAGAERLAPPDLLAVLRDAERHRTKVVLVDTGRRALNESVAGIAERLGALDPGSFGPEPEPTGVQSTVAAAPTLGDAMSLLARDAVASGRPVIALRSAEVTALNGVARSMARRAARLDGPSVEGGGRLFQPGDRVLALRGERRLNVHAGEFGYVAARHPQALVVAWDVGRQTTLPLEFLAGGGLGYGYATTPAFAPPGPRLELGTTHIMAPCAPAVAGPGAGRWGAGSPPGVDVAAVVAAARVELGRGLDEMAAALDATAIRQTGSGLGPGPDMGRASRRAAISTAIELRERLLGAAVARQPSRAVQAAIGPSPPPGCEDLARWRRAAGAIEAHRERFGLPDEPLGRRGSARDPVRAVAELAVAALCRDIGEDRGRGLA